MSIRQFVTIPIIAETKDIQIEDVFGRFYRQFTAGGIDQSRLDAVNLNNRNFKTYTCSIGREQPSSSELACQSWIKLLPSFEI